MVIRESLGLKAGAVVVNGIDRSAKTVAVKTADGTEETWQLTGRAAGETGKGVAKGATVTAYYTSSWYHRQAAELFVALDCPYALELAIGTGWNCHAHGGVVCHRGSIEPTIAPLVRANAAWPGGVIHESMGQPGHSGSLMGDRAGSQRYGLRRNGDDIDSEILSGRPW